MKNGKRYVLFPEGGYKFNNKNKVQDFKAGSFKIALKSHVPIIPIALIDSYKVFNSFHFGPVTTQVHYLKPIEYDEYKDVVLIYFFVFISYFITLVMIKK